MICVTLTLTRFEHRRKARHADTWYRKTRNGWVALALMSQPPSITVGWSLSAFILGRRQRREAASVGGVCRQAAVLGQDEATVAGFYTHWQLLHTGQRKPSSTC